MLHIDIGPNSLFFMLDLINMAKILKCDSDQEQFMGILMLPTNVGEPCILDIMKKKYFVTFCRH